MKRVTGARKEQILLRQGRGDFVDAQGLNSLWLGIASIETMGISA
jgi:hypothetical protein